MENMPKVGMRTVKSSISVFLCLLFFEIINRDNPTFACVAAIICMQPTIDNTWDKGISRIVGTIIGGLLSIFLIVIDKTNLIEQAYIVLIPLGIIILIELCVFIGKKDSVVISCVVYLSIMITQRHEGNYMLYTFTRVIDTSIGIMVALLVNRYLKTPKWFLKFKNNKNLNDEDNKDINNINTNNKESSDNFNEVQITQNKEKEDEKF